MESEVEVTETHQDEGIFQAIVSTDAMDDEGDIIETEGWQYRDHIPVLWAHSQGAKEKVAIGHITEHTALPSPEGTGKLIVEGDIDLNDELGRKIWRKLKRGDVAQFSVGFNPIEVERIEREGGRYHFMEQKLTEVSIVNVGANEETGPIMTKDNNSETVDKSSSESESKSVSMSGEAEVSLSEDTDDSSIQIEVPLSKLLDEASDDFPQDSKEVDSKTKEGRRNRKMDEEVMDHVKDCISYLKGDIDKESVKACPLHKTSEEKPGDHDEGKSGEETEEKSSQSSEKSSQSSEKSSQSSEEKSQEEVDSKEVDSKEVDSKEVDSKEKSSQSSNKVTVVFPPGSSEEDYEWF
jgi:HK97 family phage prohead protease